MFIAYDTKNGTQYAKLYTTKRNGTQTTKTYQNLGKVLDKQQGIYQNKQRGIFTYNLKTNTYNNPPPQYVPPPKKHKKQPLILDFGDTYFLDAFIKTNNLHTTIQTIEYANPDTLNAMIAYYTLSNMANCHAQTWYEGNYARILYPKANLTSQRISDFLTTIGKEHNQRNFFQKYIKLLEQTGIDTSNILIDGSGLPNNIHFPLSAIRNHKGEIKNETRLIYVTQQNTGLPIYFRYCPGNVIDASTLIRCIAELKEQGVNTKFSILDAGYYTDENIKELFDNKISFLTRLRENRVLYKKLVLEHLGVLERRENLVEYNGRYVYLKCVSCELVGHGAHAYVGLDVERRSLEMQKTFRRAKDQKLDAGQVYDVIAGQGVFVLVSSRRIALDKVLPLYYTRQQIEQVFDIGKNYADLLPLRVASEAAFRGHLFLTFVVTVVFKMLQDALKGSSVSPLSLFLVLRNHKCKVYDTRVITQEVFKKANDCYRLFDMKCPVSIARE
jgi:hypothetical protein